MSVIRTAVRGTYDVQKLRIQMGNRIVGNFKAKLGQEPGKAEETLDEESKALLAKIRGANKLVATGAVVELEKAKKKEEKVAEFIHALIDKHYAAMSPDGMVSKKKFVGNPVISDYTEYALITEYKELEAFEAKHFRILGKLLEDYPIWNEYLSKVRGIGPAMAGVIISEINIAEAKYPSSIWMYAGLDVAPDGKGRSRRKEHLIQRKYIDKAGKEEERASITFNPFLKTKLLGVLGTSFLRSGNEKYVGIYKDYKNRLENHVVHKEKTKAHRHNMAIRYMIKRFLVDLYREWRTLEGLPVAPEYSEGKLGYKHAA